MPNPNHQANAGAGGGPQDGRQETGPPASMERFATFYKKHWFMTFVGAVAGSIAFLWIGQIRVEKVEVELARAVSRAKQAEDDTKYALRTLNGAKTAVLAQLELILLPVDALTNSTPEQHAVAIAEIRKRALELKIRSNGELFAPYQPRPDLVQQPR